VNLRRPSHCFFSVRLSLIVMKLGVNDVRERGCKVTERILNICINFDNCQLFKVC